MPASPVTEVPPTPENMPFAAPCRTLDRSAPLRWLRLGWADIMRAPRLSLAYGAVLMALSMLIAALSWRYGMAALYLGLATGFIFIGPLLAVGLYSISRQLSKGQKPVMGYCVREGWHHIKELLVLGIVLLVVMLVWARAAATLHVFFPVESNSSLDQWLPFLGIGSGVGALFTLIRPCHLACLSGDHRCFGLATEWLRSDGRFGLRVLASAAKRLMLLKYWLAH